MLRQIWFYTGNINLRCEIGFTQSGKVFSVIVKGRQYGFI